MISVFTYILQFNHHNNSVGLGLHPFYRWGDWDLKRLNDMPKSTQWVNAGVMEVKDILNVRGRWNTFVVLSLAPLALEIKGLCQDELYWLTGPWFLSGVLGFVHTILVFYLINWAVPTRICVAHGWSLEKKMTCFTMNLEMQCYHGGSGIVRLLKFLKL